MVEICLEFSTFRVTFALAGEGSNSGPTFRWPQLNNSDAKLQAPQYAKKGGCAPFSSSQPFKIILEDS